MTLYLPSILGHLRKLIYLMLAKQLAEHMVINEDIPSTEIAFDAFVRLALAAINVEGKTFPAFNIALRAFEEIKQGPAIDTAALNSQLYINKIKQAKRSKVAFTAQLLAVYAREIGGPYWGSGDFNYPKSRTSRSMQARAADGYQSISGALALIAASQPVNSRASSR